VLRSFAGPSKSLFARGGIGRKTSLVLQCASTFIVPLQHLTMNSATALMMSHNAPSSCLSGVVPVLTSCNIHRPFSSLPPPHAHHRLHLRLQRSDKAERQLWKYTTQSIGYPKSMHCPKMAHDQHRWLGESRFRTSRFDTQPDQIGPSSPTSIWRFRQVTSFADGSSICALYIGALLKSKC
jgi:hypothetical protein